MQPYSITPKAQIIYRNANDSILMAKNHIDMGNVMVDCRNDSSALAEYNAAMDIYTALYGTHNAFVAKCHSQIAVVLFNQQLSKNIRSRWKNVNTDFAMHLDTALSIYQYVYKGERREEIAETYYRNGELYGFFDFRMAIDYFGKALDEYRAVYGDENHLMVARTLRSMGGCYNRLGEYDAAIHNMEQAITILEHLYQGKHSEIADTYELLSGAYGNRKNTIQCMLCLEKAANIWKLLYGKEYAAYRNTINSFKDYMIDYHLAKDVTDAENVCEEALKIYKRLSAETSNQLESAIARLLVMSTLAHIRNSNVEKAKANMTENTEICKRITNTNLSTYCSKLTIYANALLTNQSDAERVLFYRRAKQLFKEYANDNPMAKILYDYWVTCK